VALPDHSPHAVLRFGEALKRSRVVEHQEAAVTHHVLAVDGDVTERAIGCPRPVRSDGASGAALELPDVLRFTAA